MKNIKIIAFLKQNYLYILIAFIYFMLNFAFIKDLGLAIFIYAISLAVALSPFGEFVFRQINNVRELYTIEEKEYLMPIFEEVYQEVEKNNPKASANIGMYICDEMTINAYAIGYHTVAVTQGAVETLSKEELKGLLAHEFGHIIHGDTKMIMLITIGSGIFSMVMLICKAVMVFLDYLAKMFDSSKTSTFALNLFKVIVNIVMIVFTFVIQTGLAINSRTQEFSADMFAHEIGFGSELISAFYIMQKTALRGKESIANKIKATHPHIARRIGALERAQGIEYIG